MWSTTEPGVAAHSHIAKASVTSLARLVIPPSACTDPGERLGRLACRVHLPCMLPATCAWDTTPGNCGQIRSPPPHAADDLPNQGKQAAINHFNEQRLLGFHEANYIPFCHESVAICEHEAASTTAGMRSEAARQPSCRTRTYDHGRFFTGLSCCSQLLRLGPVRLRLLFLA